MSHAQRSYPHRIRVSGLVTIEIDAVDAEQGRVAALRMLDGDDPPSGVRLRDWTVQAHDWEAIDYPAEQLPVEWREPMARMRFGELGAGRLRWIAFTDDAHPWLTNGHAAICAAGHDVPPERITKVHPRLHGCDASPNIPPRFGEPNTNDARPLVGHDGFGVADKYLRLVGDIFGEVEWGWLGVRAAPLVAWKNGDDVALVMGAML